MARTTIDLVKGVLGKDYDASRKGNLSLQPFIDTASILVNKIALLPNSGDSDELEMVERWLSAHNYCQMDKAFQSRSLQGSSASFQGQTAKGFESTLYGQMAMRVDSSGYLYRLDGRRQASCDWLGTVESAQTTYDERNG